MKLINNLLSNKIASFNEIQEDNNENLNSPLNSGVF